MQQMIVCQTLLGSGGHWGCPDHTSQPSPSLWILKGQERMEVGLHSVADKGTASGTRLSPRTLQVVWLQILVPPSCVTFLAV